MPPKSAETLPVAAWRAPAPDGVAHAFARRRSGRTYCDRPTWDERHDWPTKSKCAACVAAITPPED